MAVQKKGQSHERREKVRLPAFTEIDTYRSSVYDVTKSAGIISIMKSDANTVPVLTTTVKVGTVVSM